MSSHDPALRTTPPLSCRRSFPTRALLAVLVVAFAFAVAPAMAADPYEPIGSFDGTGSTGGKFTHIQDLAVNDADDRVLVFDDLKNGMARISQFDLSGNPVAFSAEGVAPSTSINVPAALIVPGGGVAVDNSGTASNGNFYAVSGDKLLGFDDTGAPLATFPVELEGSPWCGSAVDPLTGNVYVPDYYDHTRIRVYSAAGVEQGSATTTAGSFVGCLVDFDKAGNLHALTVSAQVVRYPRFGESFGESFGLPTVFDSQDAETFGADLGDGRVFVTGNINVRAFDSAGVLQQTLVLKNPGSATAEADSHRLFVPDAFDHISGFRERVRMFGGLAGPPVFTGEASALQPTGGTLNGSVNPKGLEVTDCRFEYGTSDAYGNSVPCAESVGSGDADVPVSAAVSGLEANTTYHFRLSVTNSNGTTNGDDATFTTPAPPEVASIDVLDVGTTSAMLAAEIDPNRAAATYRIEYGPTTAYGQATAQSASIGSGDSPVETTKELTGLSPDTLYHFRVLATNAAGTTESADRTFTTHPTPPETDTCPNADRRWGPSKNLPDCRAYELVTPPDTNAQIPHGGAGSFTFEGGLYGIDSDYFDTSPVAPGGDSYLWMLVGTPLPGLPGGNGQANHYLADRTADGWRTDSAGPTYLQMPTPGPGSASGDLRYQVFMVNQREPLGTLCCYLSKWLRQPDGSYRPVGEGTVPVEDDTDGFDNGKADSLYARLVWISESGDHQIVSTSNAWNAVPEGSTAAVPLTADAPPAGVAALYDRTPGGVKLVSVLPDGTAPDVGSFYAGVSSDSSVIAFRTGVPESGALYVRVDNQATQLVAPADPELQFGWVTNDEAFYSRDGDLYVYDLTTEVTTRITTTGDATFVRVAENGDRVFFLSPSQLDGASGTAGQPNLYVWDGEETRFIATILAADVSNATSVASLDRWVAVASRYSPANRWHGALNSSRATADGGVFAFETKADLTGQNPGGHTQVYRYEAATAELVCVSCPTDGRDAPGHGTFWERLKTNGGGNVFAGAQAVSRAAVLPNLTPDGRAIYFESTGSLVAADRDRFTSVYEWRDGELRLLSSGGSGADDHYAGSTPDGSEVFILTGDRLVPEPQERGMFGIYAARVGGGFPIPEAGRACSGEVCLAPDPGAAAPPLPSVGISDPRDGAAGRSRQGTTGKVRADGRTVQGARLVVKVRAPGAGTIKVGGSRVKNVRKRAGRTGTVRVKLRLTSKARRMLRARKQLEVALTVAFTPDVGRRSSTRLRVTVEQPRSKRSRRAASRGAQR